jgi:hypothetical protein
MSYPRAATMAAVLVLTVLFSQPAHAQYYSAVYLGGNRTMSTDVSINQPSHNTAVAFHDVTFSAKPFQSPQYYGVRLGRLFGPARDYGVEVEFIHLKVIANTEKTVGISGQVAGVGVGPSAPMETIVDRYSMTHGLNFLLINAVVRQPVGSGRMAIIARAGAGPTLPHAETSVLGAERAQYEFAGMGAHFAGGLDIRLRTRISALVEYKLTVARPQISIDAGDGQMLAITHQVAVGLAFGLSR